MKEKRFGGKIRIPFLLYFTKFLCFCKEYIEGLTMQAKIEKEYIKLLCFYALGDDYVAEVNCKNYDEYESLPSVIRYNNFLMGKTGWNSDTWKCCYKNNVMIAKRI